MKWKVLETCTYEVEGGDYEHEAEHIFLEHGPSRTPAEGSDLVRFKSTIHRRFIPIQENK